MKKNILIVLLFTSLASYGQNRMTYKFVVETKMIIDTATGFYRGAELEYIYSRIYLSDSVFEERGLFSRDSTNTAFFKVKNGYWYYKFDNKWRMFYSKGKDIAPKIKIGEIWYKLYPTDTSLLKGNKCVVFIVKPLDTYAGDEIKYWFSPEKGIIKIETSEVALIREDIGKSL